MNRCECSSLPCICHPDEWDVPAPPALAPVCLECDDRGGWEQRSSVEPGFPRWVSCPACAVTPLPHIPELFKIVCRQCGDHQAVVTLATGDTYTLNCTRCTVTEIL